MTNYYDDLGIPTDATPEQVRRGFQKKASQYHPDKQGGDAEKMKAVIKARDVLSDPARRAHYDKTGEDDPRDRKNDIERMIRTIFANLIESGEIESCNIVEKAIEIQARNVSNCEEFIEESHEAQAKLQRHLGRVQAKGDNLFNDVLQGGISVHQQNIAKAERDLQTVKQTLEILKTYRDERPGQPESTVKFHFYTSPITGAQF
jgi:curved DNA-binding protein CbpA